MTEGPQKVSTCKYCHGEITWKKDPVTQKSYPKNLNGSPHLCKSNNTAPAQEKTPEQINKEREEYNKKAAAAGFQTGAEVKEQANTGSCTSPEAPALNPSNSRGLKTVEGQIVALDVPAHKITLKTKDGQQHSFVWTPAMHDKMSQLKQWWFSKLTGEHVPDVDIWRLTAQEFFRRPDDWPAPQHGGGRAFQPRNEKLIVVQTMLKAYCELWCNTCTPDTITFDAARAEILAAVEADLPKVLKAGGVS